VEIIAQNPPVFIDIVITKQNYYRYHVKVQVIPPSGPFVIPDSYIVVDESGNNNGNLDYGETVNLDMNLKNLGSETAENVIATITSADEFVTILDNTAEAGSIAPGQTVLIDGAFAFSAAGNIPNGHYIQFDMEATNGDTVWSSSFSVKAHAPLLEYVEYTISDVNGNNNGRLDPGETADLIVSLKNKGAADAYDVYGLLASADPFIQVIADSMSYGNIAQNETIAMTFQVSAVVITPPGHQADFSVIFSGNSGITASGDFYLFVGLFPILILDLDGNQNSADKMQDAIEDWRVFAEYADEIPADLSQYQTIFLSLGTYSENHVMDETEAAPFIDFLNDGGNLYMEGADTWYYDQLYDPTSLHPMFHISGLSDGTDDLGTLTGVDGTLTEGMEYFFNGDNSYIDHIAPIAPAFNIFNNTSPAYQAAVAYNAGTYKTIGSAFEFGGLVDNQNYTKKSLMEKYLEFFGMDPISEIPQTPVGDTIVCANMASCIYSTQPVEGANYYIWELNPPGAGIIEGWDTAVTVNWTPGYLGPTTLRVCGMNQNGLGPVSTSLLVNHVESPTAVASFTETEICAGDTTWVNITLTGTTPWNLIISLGGNEVPMFSNKPNMDGIPFNPTADIEVTLISVTDGTGCTTTGFPTDLITVLPLPATPAKPAGPENVDLFAGTQSAFTTTGSESSINYEWTLDPEEAGTLTISETGMDCTVDWVSTFTGPVTLKVKGLNDCGESDFSDPLAVTVANTFGLDENESWTSIAVMPNPGRGGFNFSISGMEDDVVNIKVINSTGKAVYQKENIAISGNYNTMIDLSGNSNGIYYIQVEGKNSTYFKKIILQK
jgi:hypothetical protein